MTTPICTRSSLSFDLHIRRRSLKGAAPTPINDVSLMPLIVGEEVDATEPEARMTELGPDTTSSSRATRCGNRLSGGVSGIGEDSPAY